MCPVLYLGSYSIEAWGVINTMALIVFLYICLKEAHYRKISTDTIWQLNLWIIIAGVIGAALYHTVAIEEEIPLINEFTGLAFHGSVIGGGIAIYLFCRIKKMKVLPLADIVVPAVAMSNGIGRLACFAQGCCYGNPTTLSIGVRYTHPLTEAPKQVFLHPSQLYIAIGCFALAYYTHWLLKNKNMVSGMVLAHFLIGYGGVKLTAHFFMDPYRGRLIYGLSNFQYFGLAALIMGGVLLKYINKDNDALKERMHSEH